MPPKLWTRVATSLIVGCSLAPVVFGQSPQESPPSVGFTIKSTQLPSSAAAGITEIPLPVDMKLAKQFVSIGFGPMVLGENGFQST